MGSLYEPKAEKEYFCPNGLSTDFRRARKTRKPTYQKIDNIFYFIIKNSFFFTRIAYPKTFTLMEEYWINVSEVKTGREQPDGKLAAADTGLWHNYTMYMASARAQEIGYGPESAPKWIDYLRAQAKPLSEAEQQVIS